MKEGNYFSMSVPRGGGGGGGQSWIYGKWWWWLCIEYYFFTDLEVEYDLCIIYFFSWICIIHVSPILHFRTSGG